MTNNDDNDDNDDVMTDDLSCASHILTRDLSNKCGIKRTSQYGEKSGGPRSLFVGLLAT
jgi:hypothetical protein